jgi:hypothetical protein
MLIINIGKYLLWIVLLRTPQSQEEAVQSSPSQSDAKPSADAEPTTPHENEEHDEEESQEGGQTDAGGDKETLA